MYFFFKLSFYSLAATGYNSTLASVFGYLVYWKLEHFGKPKTERQAANRYAQV